MCWPTFHSVLDYCNTAEVERGQSAYQDHQWWDGIDNSHKQDKLVLNDGILPGKGTVQPVQRGRERGEQVFLHKHINHVNEIRE